MVQQAQQAGLAVTHIPTPGEAAYLVPATDSFGEFMLGTYQWWHERLYRRIGYVRFGCECLDRSFVDKRTLDPTYQPRNEVGPYLTVGSVEAETIIRIRA